MIDAFDEKEAWLYKQDTEFVQGLLAHLQPTMIRLLYGMKIHNPVLENVRQEYPEVFERCRSVAAVLGAHLNRTVPEDEIGFIAIHFGAAKVRLDSRRETIRPVRIGVVCASGIGISRLMSSKIKHAFRDRVQLHTYGKRELTPAVIRKTDFLVSSIPLESEELPVVSVNPLLSDADMQVIRRMLFRFERMPEKQNEQDAFSMQLETINHVTAQINAILQSFAFFRVDAVITFETLLQEIGQRLASVPEQAETVAAAIQAREDISTQIIAEFGFALLHARSHGVDEPRLAICLPESGNCFTDAYFKQIRVVFIMLIP